MKNMIILYVYLSFTNPILTFGGLEILAYEAFNCSPCIGVAYA